MSHTNQCDRPMTPDAALEQLMVGNARYVEGCMTSENLPAARSNLAAGQSPFAAIIRCADSRVAPEIVFDQPLGDLFVCGVAGNIPTSEIIASMEFGVAVLGAKAIVVMGHSGCGAVSAAVKHRHDTSALPGTLPDLIDQIVPCISGVASDDPASIAQAIAVNALHGVDLLRAGSQILSDAVKAGDLKIVAGVQDLASGRFTLVEGH